MKERSIIMSAEEVRAILDGRKTQTRRVIKWPLLSQSDGAKRRVWMESDIAEITTTLSVHQRDPMRRGLCPYGVLGDKLWLKHDFWLWKSSVSPANTQIWDEYTKCVRWQDGRAVDNCEPNHDNGTLWKKMSPICMPRWASRITLEITDVRVQRVREISEKDAKAEGCKSADYATERECILDPELGSYKVAFHSLWDSINAKKHPWSSNPWVWAVTFRRLEQWASQDALKQSAQSAVTSSDQLL